MAVAAFAYTRIMNNNLTVSPQKSVRRTQMADGLQKQAARYSKTLGNMSITYLMTDAEYLLFLTWWKTTAAFGSQFFDFKSPVTDLIEDGRMIEGTYEAIPVNTKQTHWYVSMNVEVWL